MQTNQLQRIHPNKKRMIVARGGKRGKTSGRGGKGQSARAGNKRRSQWRDIIKQLPKLRGRGVNSNKSIQTKQAIINIGVLNEVFNAGDMVNPTTLIEKGAVNLRSGLVPSIKILGDGEVTKAFKISGCNISESAKMKIEKAGGSVEVKVATFKPVVNVGHAGNKPSEAKMAAAAVKVAAAAAKAAKPAKKEKPAKVAKVVVK